MSFRLSLRAAALALTGLLAGCATLPSSGPTGSQIIKAQSDPANPVAFKLVELDTMAALPPKEDIVPPADLVAAPPPRPSDLIGPGDMLNIVIYEAGVTVFSGSNARVSADGAAYDPAAHAERLPSVRVDDEGYITLPYVGHIRAAGQTPGTLQRQLVAALSGKSQNPQVLVAVDQSITNSIIVNGEVGRSGRLLLASGRETLEDVVALAGGYRGDAAELVVRLERGGRTWESRLTSVLGSPAAGIRILPGDRLAVLKQQQSFSVFGGASKVDQVLFGSTRLSLSEAVARAGGSNAYLGDPAAIFVFRFVPDPVGNQDIPVVYHLNMMRAGSFFVAQKFAMRDKDILYVGNARANQPSKLIQLISQLFAPFATVRAATQ